MPPEQAERRLDWLRAPGAKGSITLTAALVVLFALIGLVLLPVLRPYPSIENLWDAICSAAGVAHSPPSGAMEAADYHPSQVVVTSEMLNVPTPNSVGRGATLALKCAICHGPGGRSESQFPNLAGQQASVVFKELQDFKSGARVNAVMAPFAQEMSDQDMIDVASYYASLPRQPPTLMSAAADMGPPAIILHGDPMRGIAPCESCHGGLESKVASPRLDGQAADYIRAQLVSFASGARRNDINEQMRNIARRMTPAEIESVTAYYASRRLTALGSE
jgi:cytochrome c553